MVDLKVKKSPHPHIAFHTNQKTSLKTYTGTTCSPLKKGLPKEIQSFCPECKEVIEATLFEHDGKVMMEKSCAIHGDFQDIYWSDVDLYLKAERWVFEEGKGVMNPQVKGSDQCPDECGLCNRHMSHTGLGNIDLTNRCNLLCPVCFANSKAKGFVYEPSFPDIVKMLEIFQSESPAPCKSVQFSGGEPTLSPHFIEAIKKAREMGFAHIQAATNGIRFNDIDFTHKCKDAGLHTIYLQFDGFKEDIYIKMRGRALLETKLKAIENIRRARMKIVFVPTIVRGFNDDQVGEILKFAVQNIDVVSGIAYQPIAFTGRTPQEDRMKMRYTLSDLAFDIEKQTGLLKAKESWYPISFVSPISRLLSSTRGEEITTLTCHPHCGLATYLFVDDDKKATPITDFVDVENMFIELNRLSKEIKKARFKSFSKIKALNHIKKCFNREKAPKGLSFEKFLYTIEGLIDKRAGRRDGKEKTFKSLLLFGMHFQDLFNFDIDRVKRCVVHYAAPNAHLYPFCAYNSGSTLRHMIEKNFSKEI